MLMKLEMMKYAEPIGDYIFHFDVENADKSMLKEAIAFDESYSEIYGHRIFDNLADIKKALTSK